MFMSSRQPENQGPAEFDRPDGTLWRLDVLASSEALESGSTMRQCPTGPQDWSRKPRALCSWRPPLTAPAMSACRSRTASSFMIHQRTDATVTLRRPVCLAIRNLATPVQQPPSDYCLVMPGQTTGYCTRKGCIDGLSVSGWLVMLDLSRFQPCAYNVWC